MKIRFTARARSDIAQIRQHLDERSPIGARNVLASIGSALAAIAEMPEASQRTNDPRIRVRIVGRYGYKIFFTVERDCIDILHIRHGSRGPWRDPG